ncbi:protein FAM114A2 isoform X2 [Bacillus rossius redtenbacheri]|uniref:protein FAM114A2 isoform X2 n=1 Tax=Bacillus rossius redtenbacheri TaxID=93214 RepID=UPI002FDCF55A
MATSESDDFESADEDVEDSKTLSVDRPTQGTSAIGRSDASSSSCSSTLTSSGCDVAPTTDAEVDRLGTTKNAAVEESDVLTAGVGGLEVADDRDRQPIDTQEKRDVKSRQTKTKQSKSTGVKKLGTKIVPASDRSGTVTAPPRGDAAECNVEKLAATDYSNKRGTPPSHDGCAASETHGPQHGGGSPANISAAENISEVLEKTEDTSSENEKGWGGWGGWGVSSLLSSATEGVASLTSQVSQGLSTVLEAGIGAPDPEELARLHREESRAAGQHEQEEQHPAAETRSQEAGSGVFGLGQLMSGVSSITRLVESTGARVISGGLDTLETIGKKTMEVLQEGDPGLKRKRALFGDHTVLSQVLREAKQRAEAEDSQRDERQQARKAHFETLFDDYQGLVHLEALEMLSRQCELRRQAALLGATGPRLAALQAAGQRVQGLCLLPDCDEQPEEPDEDWQARLAAAAAALPVPFLADRILKTWGETAAWLDGAGRGAGAREVHRRAIEGLARLTAESVEQFHKAAELLLVQQGRDPAGEARLFVQITSAVTSALNLTATSFSEHLSKCPANSLSPDEVNNLITNVFLEANNSSSYMEEALRLLVPVLQVALEE